jgi:hypothetical protein
VAALALRDLATSRSGRVGRRLTVSGAALIATCTTLLLVTGLATGRPWEAAFWLFLLGFLLIIVGAEGWYWAAAPVAGAGALVAVLTESPLHEVGLFAFDLAWIGLGLGLLATPAAVRQGAARVG